MVYLFLSWIIGVSLYLGCVFLFLLAIHRYCSKQRKTMEFLSIEFLKRFFFRNAGRHCPTKAQRHNTTLYDLSMLEHAPLSMAVIKHALSLSLPPSMHRNISIFLQPKQRQMESVSNSESVIIQKKKDIQTTHSFGQTGGSPRVASRNFLQTSSPRSLSAPSKRD